MNKKISIPIASCFDYSNFINLTDINNAINIIDKLISNGRYRNDRPTFQTIDDLFLFDEFSKFKISFIDASKKLLNIDSEIDASAFCYTDYYDNFKLKIRDNQWHKHETHELIGVMYLKNEEYSVNRHSGTEFADEKLNSIGYIEPIPYCWHLFSGHRFHRSGIITTNNKRYVLTAGAVL